MLLNIQKLLAEGIFTATYKFALLTAIADICVEKGHDDDRPLEIRTYEIAGKFIEYYWSHSVPFRESVLVQSTGRPASVITRLEPVQMKFRSLQALRASPEWNRVVRKIAGTVKGMPMWKLQTVRSGQSEFIYKNQFGSDSITLLPGVCRSLRLFHGLTTEIVRGAWVEFIRKLASNQGPIGPHGDLEAFLFGESRSSLSALRASLTEIL